MKKTFSLLTLLLALTVAAHATDNSQSADLKAKAESLRPYIYPLSTFEPDGNDFADIDKFWPQIKDADIIALGEGTHGTAEFFKMKHRFVKYLATKRGFNIFSIEANLPEAYKVNDYTIRGENCADSVISGMYFWTWSTEEVKAMVEWMKEYNAGEQKLLFTGFDMQFHQEATKQLSEALAEDSVAIKHINNILIGLSANRSRLGGITKQEDVNEVLTKVKDNTTRLKGQAEAVDERLKQSSRADDKMLGYCSLVLQQYLESTIQDINYTLDSVKYETAFDFRDKCMADNLLMIAKDNPGSKTIAWAHNAHINNEFGAMGNFMKKQIGDKYATIGFSFYDGSYTAVDTEARKLSCAISSTPPDDSIEAVLNEVGEPIFILDLKRLEEEGKANTDWLTPAIKMRCIGSGVVPTKYEFLDTPANYDYIIFINETSYSRLFPNYTQY